VAEQQQQQLEFVPVAAQDILEDRREGWDRFVKAVSWGIAIVAASLILLAILAG